jgi:hypothetical protein
MKAPGDDTKGLGRISFDRLHKDDMRQAETVTAAVLCQAATQSWE